MPAPRRPAAPRTGAASDDDARRGEPASGPASRPTPRPAPRTAGVPRSPAPGTRSPARTPAPTRSTAPATSGQVGPASGRTGADRTGAPQQSVPRPATPRPAASRARSAPSSTPRPASRPGSSRPGERGGGPADRRPGRAETVQQRLPRLFTVRALVMFVVLSIAFVLVFPTLRQYLDQQVQLEQLRAEVAAAEQSNEDLQAELDRWSDPAYVEAQARERLAFVMPGERALRVADPEVVPDTTGTEAPVGPSTVEPDDPTRPWYAQLWDSVQVAGVAGTGTGTAEPTAPTGEGTAPTGKGTAPTGEGTAPTGDNGTAPATDGSTAPTP